MQQAGKRSHKPLEIDDEPRIVEESNPYTEGMTEEEEFAAAIRLFDIIMGDKPKIPD
ncbi:hypothetical protein ACFL1V_07910 [Pseudomonadota bacterium]